ncbi:MAG TPA: hypothetical protein VKQ36_04960 [Ktedonobacterales bacterium]|nr:hypothetical protein [Ktedonobacterales bacterium]
MTAVHQLRASFLANPRIEPFVEGAVSVPGARLEWTLGHPATLHLKHLHENCFDVFEFSLSGYLVARDRPQWASLGWTALPVFLAKAFLPFELYVNRSAHIRTWADLAGKRIGVPDYNMTAAIWLRILLRELYGVQPSEIEWVNGRRPTERHSTVLGFREGAGKDHVWEIDDLRHGAALGDLLAEGIVDAAFGDGKSVPIVPGRRVRLLLRPSQARALMERFTRKTGASPINHVVIIKQDVLACWPESARLFYTALEQSKLISYERAVKAAGAYLLFPAANFADQERALGRDPFPSGIAANRRTLDLLMNQMVAEGQLDRPMEIETLFAESMRNT